MYCKDLLLRVFDADVVEGATYEDCVLLLDGAIRLGVAMSDDLSEEIITWLLDTYGPVGWPDEPRVGQLINGYDGWYSVSLYPDNSELRQDAHVIVLPKEAQVSINVKEAPVTQAAAAAKRRYVAADKMMMDAIAATKRAIARMTAQKAAAKPDVAELIAETLAANEEAFTKVTAPAPVADPTKYPVQVAELLPALLHRTSDGRWYLKEHRIAFRLEHEGRTLIWNQKGIVPKKWKAFAGTVMLVPAVVAPKASAS